MTLSAQVQGTVRADRQATSGLTREITNEQIEFSFNTLDCTKVWSDRRTFTAAGFDDVDLLGNGLSTVKLVCVKNLSSTSSIGLTAGWTGSQFANFRRDVDSWNFSPMINLGSLTLRGYPIREGGAFLLSCPNSAGFATTGGGSILRVGGVSGQSYEIYVMGN